MKKGQVLEGTVMSVDFPNKGQVRVPGEERVAMVKNALPGQSIRFAVTKIRKGKAEGRLLEVLRKSPLETEEPCAYFGQCGGCAYQGIPYEEQLRLKEAQVRRLLLPVLEKYGQARTARFEGIKASPRELAYRNKMEFSFGDGVKGGPLCLGMHKRGSFHDIVTVDGCRIADADYSAIVRATLAFFQERGIPFYHKYSRAGYLRHLLVRKAAKTGEILIDLITTTQQVQGGGQMATVVGDPSCPITTTQQEWRGNESACGESGDPWGGNEQALLADFTQMLLGLDLDGSIAGILHTKNDSLADAVINQGTELLYGQDSFYEELLGLRFCITPFSFFQTNSLGAEELYETAREYIGGDGDGKLVYDLYSGTGTIAQILAPAAKKVIGVEIVEEATQAARENAIANGLTNCEFIAGDVLKVLDGVWDGALERPEFIVLDPPRDGVHPKALEKIIRFGVEKILYISCKPTSLARDLEALLAGGYEVQRICCVDMFPQTTGVETVVCLSQQKPER